MTGVAKNTINSMGNKKLHSLLFQFLQNIVSNIKSNYIPIVSLFSLSFLYIGLIGLWAKGKLLFGGDMIGFYHLYNFFAAPSVSSFLWGVSNILTAGNIYATFYLHYYITTTLAVFSIYKLSTKIFRIDSTKNRYILGITSSALFLFNPWSITLTYLSLVSDVSLSVSGFTLILLGIVMFIRRDWDRNSIVISAIISGIGIGMSLSPFPNYLRLMLVVIAMYTMLFILKVVKSHANRFNMVKAIAIFYIISLTIGLSLSLNFLIPIITSLHQISSTAASGAVDHSNLIFYTGQFNILINTLRGLNQWQFPYIFYYGLYINFGTFFTITFFWPLFALVIPLVFPEKAHRKWITALVVILLVVVFWDKGANPPLGIIWSEINKVIPYHYQLIPTGYLSGLYLDRFYPILASYSVLRIFQRLNSEENIERLKNFPKRFMAVKSKHYERFLPGVVAVAMTIILSISALPLFSGAAVTHQYNGSNKDDAGFYIPNSFYQARSDLLNNISGNILLLPPTTSNPYISTGWGYAGEIGFYPAFFGPAKIVTLNSFGGTYSSPSQIQKYEMLTEPLVLNQTTNKVQLESNYTNLLENNNISYIMVDSSITSGTSLNMSCVDTVIHSLVEYQGARIIFNSSPLVILKLSE